MAPERLPALNSLSNASIPFLQIADIYSLGVVLCELFWNVLPFQAYYESNQFDQLQAERISKPNMPPFHLPASTATVTKLLLQCIDPKPKNRPTLPQLLLGIQEARAFLHVSNELHERLQSMCGANYAGNIKSANEARWFIELQKSADKVPKTIKTISEMQAKLGAILNLK